MHDSIAHALRDWQAFYLLTGGAAATLAGLLFIALQLGISVRYPAGVRSAIETFVTPSFIRFVDVLVISTLALIPTQTRYVLGTLLLIPTAISVWSISNVLRRSLREYERGVLGGVHWVLNVSLPVAAYILLFVAAMAVLFNQSWALNGLATANIALLFTALVNAWQVVTWVATEHGRRQDEAAGTSE